MSEQPLEQLPEPHVETQDAVDNLEVPQFEVMDKGLDPSSIEHRAGATPTEPLPFAGSRRHSIGRR